MRAFLKAILFLIAPIAVQSLRADALLSTGVYTYTGSIPTFSAPPNTDYIVIKAWGAGGGEGVHTPGGGGGMTAAAVTFQSGQTVQVVVGHGGNGYSLGGWPGGGTAGAVSAGGNTTTGGAGGGGYTHVLLGGTIDLWAGAGGGGGNGGSYGGNGGPGGYPNGGAGGAVGGGGGTQTAGGSGGAGDMGAGSVGTFANGGNSNGTNGYVGGGGGAGYMGGGGGGTTSGGNAGGGGGGSSYASGNILWVNYSNGGGSTAGGTGDQDYPGNNVGNGGNDYGVYASGFDGYVIIRAYQRLGPPDLSNLQASYSYGQRQPPNFQIPATGVPAITSYGVTGGSLPPGFLLNTTSGLISGFCLTPGSYPVTLSATNSQGTVSRSTTFTIQPPVISAHVTFSNSTPNPGDTITLTVDGTANFGVWRTESTMWHPTQFDPEHDVLPMQYPPGFPTYFPPSFSYATSYTIPAEVGIYTLQFRFVDQYENDVEQTYYLNVGAQKDALPYATSFESNGSPSYLLGNLQTQHGWVVWRGKGTVLTPGSSTWPGPVAADGVNSLKIDGDPGIAAILKAFSSTDTGVFIDLYIKPAADASVGNSSVLDFNSSRIGFLAIGSGQATVMALNGTGWVDTGFHFPVDTSNQSTQWIRLTSYHDYTSHTWKLFVNGSVYGGALSPVSLGMLSNTETSFSVMNWYGAAVGSSFYDAFSASAVNPFAPSAPPSGLTSTGNTDQSFLFSWAAANSSVPIVAYQVSLRGTPLPTVTGTSMSITGLTPLTSYAMSVRALNSAGYWSDWSPASSISTLADTVPPTPPTTVSYGGVTMSSVNLSWSGATDDVGVTKYIVYRNGIQIAVLTASQLSYSDTGLAFNTTYNYTIVAYDAANNPSDPSLTQTVTTQNMPVPVITSAASIKAVLGVQFSYSITATNSPTSYAVLGTLPAGLSFSSTTGVISGTPTQLGNYSFSVSASNGGGAGASTLDVDVIPPLPIVQLLSPGATTVHVGDTITVTGQATDPIGGGLLQHYIEIQRPAGDWSAESWLLGEPWGPAVMGGHVLTFAGQATTDTTMLIDSVSVSAMPDGTPAPVQTVLENPSFEFPKIATNDYNSFLYGPTTGDWSFINTGVAANNSGYTSSNPNAPAGTQVGFIQSQGTLSQTIYLEAGSYKINAQIAKRWWGNGQSVIVTVDGQNIATFSPTALTYAPASTGSFTVGSNYRTQSTKSSPFTFNLPGTYRIRTRASNAAGWSYSDEVVVTVLPSQLPNNHNPLADVENVSATGNILSVQGWAIDFEDGMVGRVEVLIDDNLFATIDQFLARPIVPDVAIEALNYPSPRSRYVRCEWKLDKSVGALKAGNHTVRFIAYDSQGGATSFGSRSFSSSGSGSGGPTAPSTPTGRCESAALNNGTLTCAGWAIDKEDGAPIASVAAFINGVSYGNVTLGGTRLDIANYVLTPEGGAYPGPASRYNNCGWSFSASVSGLSSGTYSVTFIASDSQGNKGMFLSPTFTVNAGPLIDSDHDGIPDSVETILGTNPSGQTTPTPNDPNLLLNVQTPR